MGRFSFPILGIVLLFTAQQSSAAYVILPERKAWLKESPFTIKNISEKRSAAYICICVLNRLLSLVPHSREELIKESIKVIFPYCVNDHIFIQNNLFQVTLYDIFPWFLEGTWTTVVDGMGHVPQVFFRIWLQNRCIPFAMPLIYALSKRCTHWQIVQVPLIYGMRLMFSYAVGAIADEIYDYLIGKNNDEEAMHEEISIDYSCGLLTC